MATTEANLIKRIEKKHSARKIKIPGVKGSSWCSWESFDDSTGVLNYEIERLLYRQKCGGGCRVLRKHISGQ